jgi:predicted DNA-binding antitoxin AbrB/MazE fold protein
MITVEAIYEGGVLKPIRPLPLKEHATVQITVHSAGNIAPTAADEAELAVRRSQGLLGWTGDAETLRRLAESAELDPQEAP